MSRTANIGLSTKGLQLADRVSRKDFRFVCGSNGDAFVCDRFQAAFVSPRVANWLLSDPSIEEYLIHHTDSQGLKILYQLICGESVAISEVNAEVFIGLIEELGNVELSESVVDFVEKSDEINVSNCISRLKRRLGFSLGIANESCFIGSHLSEFETAELRGIDIATMSDILKSDSMRVPSEDWLVHLIFELGPMHLKLLGCIRFEYLSPCGIDLFFERISIADLDDRLWQQLWIRSRHLIIYDPTDIVCSSHRYPGFVTRPADSPWSGLIDYLTKLSRGNVHANGVVNVSCSSTARNQCWDLINYTWNDYWYSYPSPNSWIQFDFKDRVVSLTHYSLKSDGYGGHHLLEWAIQGSMDGHLWTDLDRRNTQELNDNYVMKVFSCDATLSSPHFYRFIRLLQTGKNSSGANNLMLGNFECFGSMANAPLIAIVPHGNQPNS
jgi:hypothetical protein